MLKRKLQIITLFLLSCTVLLITACQPTPDKAAVINKGNGELENKVKESAQISGTNSAQEGGKVVWNETKTVNIEGQNNYTVAVSVDADIPKIPDKAPVYLIEPKEFSIDFMKKISGLLMKGELYDGKRSKEDVSRELLDFKKDISAHTIIEDRKENVDDNIESFNEEYKIAADSNKEAKFEYVKNDEGQRGLRLKSYPDGYSIMHLDGTQGLATGLVDNFLFRTDRPNRSFSSLSNISGDNIQAKGTKTTYKEALAESDKTMAALFEEPFVMVRSDITDVINNNEGFWNKGEETSEGQVYVFYYTRDYSGIPELFIREAPSDKKLTEEQFKKPYYREDACIVVDDSGISEMWYDSYSDIVKTLNSNPELLPFDKVFEKFKDDIFHNTLWGFPGSTANIKVTKIEFGMLREPLKDNKNQYMMVPAWNFLGITDNGDVNSGGQNLSVLALNAIDGSVSTFYQGAVDPK